MKARFIILTLAIPLIAREPLSNRIVHTDPSKFVRRPSVHGGAGPMAFTGLLDQHSLETNLYFLHRGVIEPKGGIGHHFHNQCEEMFVILDGEAQFTIDGRTSILKGPAGALCRMGHSHAIYNHTDKPIQWMNINITALKGTYDAFDLGDPRVDVSLDKIPVFMALRLDRAMLRAVEAMNGGKGAVQYRRAMQPSAFASPWAYIDHLVIPPGASTGAHMHQDTAEFYYVMAGEGKATVGGGRGGPPETAPIRIGDAIPLQLAEAHAFENTGKEPLEFLIVGVARDMTKRVDSVDIRP